MYSEGYLGTSKLLVSVAAMDKARLVVVDQLHQDKTIHSYATSKELRHAAAMMLEAANKLDR